jgi:hypothetical protein
MPRKRQWDCNFGTMGKGFRSYREGSSVFFSMLRRSGGENFRPQFRRDDNGLEEQRDFQSCCPDHNMAYPIGVAENEGNVVTVRELLTIDSKGDQGSRVALDQRSRRAHGPWCCDDVVNTNTVAPKTTNGSDMLDPARYVGLRCRSHNNNKWFNILRS